MKIARRLMPSAACLLAIAPLAEAGDISFSGATLDRPSTAQTDQAAGWIAGSSSTRLDMAARTDVARQSDATFSSESSAGDQHGADLRASEIHAGYRSALGPLDVSAVVRYDSMPDLRAGATPGLQERGAFSAGVEWLDLSARYDYTFTHDYPGALDARGSHYLDIGARHAFGPRTWLHLNAGNGRVAGNGRFDWRDLRAGFTHRLDDGWTMALNYRRVFGNPSLAERYLGAPRFEGLIPSMGRGHRGLVLSLNRGF